MKSAGWRAGALALCLAAGTVACLWSSNTPAPAGFDAPPTAFSAARAMIDDRVIAVRPHPEGYPAAEAARDYIFQRMTALGLSPRRLPGEAVEASSRFRGMFASGGVLENLVGVLPGTDPAAPAILLMAHSDSVPGSPGAADDAAGVISALEVVRALKAAGPRRRDVVVLVTDGEETGLLGARAFFAGGDPLLKHIGLALNMEARGGGGRVAMFETGADNGAAMALFARAVKNTDALSLMSAVYKYLPNSTDFTVVKGAGFPGYNFAFLGEQFDYHSPSSTPAVLDQGSVQHMGDQVLALSRALIDAPALPGRSPDAVYSDVLGGPVIAYSSAVSGIVLALTAALSVLGAVVGARRMAQPLAIGEIARGAGAGLFTLLAAVLVLHLANRWIAGDLLRYRDLLADFGWLFFGVTALGGGAALLAWVAAFNGRGRWWAAGIGLGLGLGLLASVTGFDPFALGLGLCAAVLAAACLGRPLELWSGWLGLLSLGAAITLALQLLGPPLTVATSWPLLIGAACIVLTGALGKNGFDGAGAVVAALLCGLVAAAHLGHLASPIFTAIGPDMPEAMAILPLLGAFALYPLIAGWSAMRPAPTISGALLGLGVVGVAVAALRDPSSPRTPRPAQTFYLEDETSGRAWRASTLPRLDPWSRAALQSGGRAIERSAMAPVFDGAWLAATRPVGLARPDFTTKVGADGRVAVTVAPHARGREVRLYLQPSTPLLDVTVNGRATGLAPKPGAWVQLRWIASKAPIVLAFKGRAPGTLDLRYEEVVDGWPAGRSAPAKPADAMPWGLSDKTVLIDRAQPRW